MSLADAEQRDAVFRPYIIGRKWDLDREQTLRRGLVLASAAHLPRFPLLVGVEWRSPNGSPGDLLFFDGVHAFAVVEVKHLGHSARTKRRGDVETQARFFADAVLQMFPGATAQALVYTCDEEARGVGPRAPDARW